MSVGVMVLCAGLGTRLRPITERIPKPAIPVFDVPLVRRHFELAHRIRADDIAINTHHLPRVMRRCAEEEADGLGISIRVSHESQIQGTAGGIRDAMASSGHDLVVVLNGDTIFDVDLGGAIQAHRRSGAAATMVLAPMPRGERYAAVEADRVMRVRRIAGVGPRANALSAWHFTGVHVLGRSFFEFVPARGSCDINRDVYPEMIDRGLVVAGHVDRGYWSDVGTPARLLAVHRDFLRGRSPARESASSGAARSAVIAPGVRIAKRVYVGPHAQVQEGATLGADTFVGAGARVGRGASLRQSVVLAGTHVEVGERIEGKVAFEELRVAATRLRSVQG